ncbi:MAG: transcription-repair coupling factor [Bacteroidales bacterium]|jgi:transcription-repair coupling factor (superfamily II helicase)|nr:transcription-repair coupling factor [Bacteroidales bacterium]
MKNVVESYSSYPIIKEIVKQATKEGEKLNIKDLVGSSFALIGSAVRNSTREFNHLFILPDKEQAAYFANDLEELFDEVEEDYTKKEVMFYPSTNKRPYSYDSTENANIILRLETLNRINNGEHLMVVTYPEAISEKVVSKKLLENNSTTIKKGDEVSLDYLIDVLDEYKFDRVDFVTKSGEYAVRGGIVDVFSFSEQKPYRIEMIGDEVDSIRSFDVVSQMSIEERTRLVIVPNLQDKELTQENHIPFFSYFACDTIVWTKDLGIILDKVEKEYSLAQKVFDDNTTLIKQMPVNEVYSTKQDIYDSLIKHSVIEIGNPYIKTNIQEIIYKTSLQPVFNKSFDLFEEKLESLTLDGYDNYFLVPDKKQKERIEKIIEQFTKQEKIVKVSYLPFALSFGFIDQENKQSFFTDHQLFNRYHKYRIKDNREESEKLTLEDLVTLKPGDYVTHIDYGVGKFAGLEKIVNNGKEQETIRLVYKDNDILYVSIHALHKISRYSGKEGVEPKLNRLGSSAWQTLKNKTKQKVKDIAKDLIALYAKRKASNGFQYSADTYLQNELEASFMYEDTPDQYKATKNVKSDMEKPYPMDRLVCGDVGFGKTEVAIRAAFKAVCDNKQVAVLVPTTILAFQHYKTFTERLKDMPCNIDYINRFRTTKEKSQILKNLKDGKIDILIGTHRIVSKDVHFKDLGLLIIDEEQKFGVGIKEKIKQMKVNIDTLTLTATPIPRTLQFSLMGARDLSIITTAPPNRQPITTEVTAFDEEVIRDAIMFELSRGGQVFFVNNRVQNIEEVAGLIQRLVPQAKVVVGHGQMDGEKLEKVMLDFINEEYDVLVATTIVENGLDIPNANTIIINDAQNYGLSDLHQLRGRVGRSNKKAFCYLLVPSENILTDQAYKRLQAIEEFSSIGSGFAIAMRDLDIRGAGNILGAEQSGFISEIGYDMYNKILNEAMEELKENDFKELYQEENQKKDFVNECSIETDLEVLIPDDYITNITERLKIYKELDNMSEEKDLDSMAKELRDRFGKIPQPTMDLFDIVRLRKVAKEYAVEKLVLKREKLILTFTSNDKSDFYSSSKFQDVLMFVQRYPQHCQMKEVNKILTLTIQNIKSVQKALNVFKTIANKTN